VIVPPWSCLWSRRQCPRLFPVPRAMHMQTRRQAIACLYLVVGLFCSTAGCTTAGSQANSGTRQPASKVAPELIALHEQYTSHLASERNEPFRPANPLLRFVDGRVVVDAVASGDANALKSDLETLGMQQAVAFGRIVSGQLPILAIPSLATLPSMKFARAASAVLQGAPKSLSPKTPGH